MKFATPVVIGATVILALYVFKDRIFGIRNTPGAGGGGAPITQDSRYFAANQATNPGSRIVTGASGTLQDIAQGVGIAKDLGDIARQFGLIGSDPDPVAAPEQQAI
jgi:hypothetical protein